MQQQTKQSRVRSSMIVLAILCAMSLLLAQQPEQPNPTALLSPEQLDNLVAPIALYPDPLISQILVACTSWCKPTSGCSRIPISTDQP